MRYTALTVSFRRSSPILRSSSTARAVQRWFNALASKSAMSPPFRNDTERPVHGPSRWCSRRLGARRPETGVRVRLAEPGRAWGYCSLERTGGLAAQAWGATWGVGPDRPGQHHTDRALPGDAAIAIGPSSDDSAAGETEPRKGSSGAPSMPWKARRKLASSYPWARTLAVMLERMTPNRRLAPRRGCLARSRARRRSRRPAGAGVPRQGDGGAARSQELQPAAQSTASNQPRLPAKATGRAARGSRLHAVPTVRKRPASRLPR
jgi:hypothetical protein